MTRKPSFWKCILGVTVLSMLFIATWASALVPRTDSSVTTAQEQGKQGPVIHAPPTPTPTPPPVPPAIAHVFEIEGNAIDEGAAGTDWNAINPESNPSPSPIITGDPDGAGPIQIATFVRDDLADDQIFTQGGSKDFNDIAPSWMHTTGSVPDKDEIDHAYAALILDNTGVACVGDDDPVGCNPQFGHKVLVFGGDRHATNGDANIGFWFFQNEIALGPNGTFTGTHENGDVFVVSAFTGGGGTSTVDVYEWVGTPNPNDVTETNLDRCNALGGTLDPSGDDTICKLPATAGKASAFVNPVEIFLDWPYTPKGGPACNNDTADCPAAKGAFYEGGIDLTALDLGNTCFSTFMLETRSSASVDAVLKDFALGSFNTCVDFECSKVVAPTDVCEDPDNPGSSLPVDYTYEFKNTGSVTVTIEGVDNLLGDIIGGTGTDTVAPGETKTYFKNDVVLPLGTTGNTVTFTVHSAFEADKTCQSSAEVTVHPNATAAAGSDQAVCIDAGFGSKVFNLSGTVTNGTPSWSFVSNTAGCTIQNADTLTPTVTCTTFGSATVQLTATSNTDPTCSNAVNDLVLTVSQNPEAAAGPNLDACEDTASHVFSLLGASSMVPVGGTLEWSVVSGSANFSGQPTSSAANPNVTVTAFGETVLRLTVTSLTCGTATSDVTLTLNANPVVTIATVECSDGDSIVLEATATVNGLPCASCTFAWSGPGGATTGSMRTVTSPGNYSVTATDAHTGMTSCMGSTSKHVGLCAP
ncbi:MAG TPA: hypothetical protein VJ023_16860 [Pyrinomonadaceae bacterium]|nr:hypothetical protein [Pyrinomonadaceae bacterium]